MNGLYFKNSLRTWEQTNAASDELFAMVKQLTRKRFSYDFEGGFQEREFELIEIENSLQTKVYINCGKEKSSVWKLFSNFWL